MTVAYVYIELTSEEVRMCLKYELSPVPLMKRALADELHRLATSKEIMTFRCPHQDRCSGWKE